MMSSVAKHVSTIFNRPNVALLNPLSWQQQLQQWRGIRVKVWNNNLDQALFLMQRKMQSSGMERLIKREQLHHIKNSEKRVLARKLLERKLRSQDLARKLKSILIKKVRILDMLVCRRCSCSGFTPPIEGPKAEWCMESGELQGPKEYEAERYGEDEVMGIWQAKKRRL